VKMNGFMKGLSLAVTLTFGVILEVAAHGDVTPHPIDTSGLPALSKDWLESNPYRGNAAAIAAGAVGYVHNCAGCHGLNAVSGGVAPDLLAPIRDCIEMAGKDQQTACLKESDEFFKAATLHGKKNGEGRFTMPAYDAVFTQEAVWALKAYIDSRSSEEAGKKLN
jgi:cytochrome c-550 PedF